MVAVVVENNLPAASEVEEDLCMRMVLMREAIELMILKTPRLCSVYIVC